MELAVQPDPQLAAGDGQGPRQPVRASGCAAGCTDKPAQPAAFSRAELCRLQRAAARRAPRPGYALRWGGNPQGGYASSSSRGSVLPRQPADVRSYATMEDLRQSGGHGRSERFAQGSSMPLICHRLSQQCWEARWMFHGLTRAVQLKFPAYICFTSEHERLSRYSQKLSASVAQIAVHKCTASARKSLLSNWMGLNPFRLRRYRYVFFFATRVSRRLRLQSKRKSARSRPRARELESPRARKSQGSQEPELERARAQNELDLE